MTDQPTRKRNLFILLIIAIPLLAYSAYIGRQIYNDANSRADIMHDYSEANSILYGLFSINEWRDNVKEILTTKIEEFEFSPRQDSLLRVEITTMLNTMISKAEQKIQQEDEGFRGTIRKLAVNTFVDWDKLRQQSPEFSDAIVEQLTAEESKDRLKAIAQEELDKLTSEIYDDTLQSHLNKIYHHYETDNLSTFNEQIGARTDVLEEKVYQNTYIMLALLALFIIPWFFIGVQPWLRRPWFAVSVAFALIVLFTGLNCPMIEIDARITNVDFVLLGSHIKFDDQILFYRSKSILEVVQLLISSMRIDSKVVGVLILAFSVILPIAKMISAPLYLFGSAKIRGNKLINWLAFKSGKWSMADVMVVAIFMSYVGFDGILDNQLSSFNVDTDYYTSLSTNNTTIRPGFIIFTAYVLFGLFIAVMLGRITKKEKPASGKSA